MPPFSAPDRAAISKMLKTWRFITEGEGRRMLSGMLVKLSMVTVVLAAAFRIGWSVPALPVSAPLQPAELHESGVHTLEPVPPS
jgi:hypothetical protein